MISWFRTVKWLHRGSCTDGEVWGVVRGRGHKNGDLTLRLRREYSFSQMVTTGAVPKNTYNREWTIKSKEANRDDED